MQNFDPESFDLKSTNYTDRTEIYHIGLPHLFNNGWEQKPIYKNYNANLTFKNDSELIIKEEVAMYASNYMSGNHLCPFTEKISASIKF